MLETFDQVACVHDPVCTGRENHAWHLLDEVFVVGLHRSCVEASVSDEALHDHVAVQGREAELGLLPARVEVPAMAVRVEHQARPALPESAGLADERHRGTLRDVSCETGVLDEHTERHFAAVADRFDDSLFVRRGIVRQLDVRLLLRHVILVGVRADDGVDLICVDLDHADADLAFGDAHSLQLVQYGEREPRTRIRTFWLGERDAEASRHLQIG